MIIFSSVFLFITTAITIQISRAYAPNPRAAHPSGKLPSTREMKQKLPSIQNELRNNGLPIILIDGNNIRNEFQLKSVSALDLMSMLSSWSLGTSSQRFEEKDDEHGKEQDEASSMKPEIICVWDGGSKISSRWMDTANSTLSVFSGMQGNADDVLVQCCAYLSSRERLAECKKGEISNRIAVFTSDANLANRCKMQLMEEGTRTSKKCQIHHSVYLAMLLGEENQSTDRRAAFAPDWERQERRNSVDELEKYSCDPGHIPDSIPSADSKGKGKEVGVLNHVNEWINTGMNDLVIGRVTNGGSVLYRVDE